MKTLFVTGTDTGVGKTLVSAALIRFLVSKGQTVTAMKPVASGAHVTSAGLRNDDALQLIAAANTNFDYQQINPYVFAESIAPHLAAAKAGVEINLTKLSRQYEELADESEFVIVEGAGGWQVPLNEYQTFADWVSERQWPVILVVAIKLGCINHARLTCLDILAKKNSIAGWVANVIDESVENQQEIIQYLKNSIDAPLLGVIPPLGLEQLSNVFQYLDFELLL